jgi:hypothetical protein
MIKNKEKIPNDDKGAIWFCDLLEKNNLCGEYIKPSNKNKRADFIVDKEFLVEVKILEDNLVFKEDILIHNTWEILFYENEIKNKFSLGFIDVKNENIFIKELKEKFSNVLIEINENKKIILLNSNINIKEFCKKMNAGRKWKDKLCKGIEDYSIIKNKNLNINEAKDQLFSTEKVLRRNFYKVIFIFNNLSFIKNYKLLLLNKKYFKEKLKDDIELIIFNKHEYNTLRVILDKKFEDEVYVFYSKENYNKKLINLLNYGFLKDKLNGRKVIIEL